MKMNYKICATSIGWYCYRDGGGYLCPDKIFRPTCAYFKNLEELLMLICEDNDINLYPVSIELFGKQAFNLVKNYEG